MSLGNLIGKNRCPKCGRHSIASEVCDKCETPPLTEIIAAVRAAEAKANAIIPPEMVGTGSAAEMVCHKREFANLACEHILAICDAAEAGVRLQQTLEQSPPPTPDEWHKVCDERDALRTEVAAAKSEALLLRQETIPKLLGPLQRERDDLLAEVERLHRDKDRLIKAAGRALPYIPITDEEHEQLCSAIDAAMTKGETK